MKTLSCSPSPVGRSNLLIVKVIDETEHVTAATKWGFSVTERKKKFIRRASDNNRCDESRRHYELWILNEFTDQAQTDKPG